MQTERYHLIIINKSRCYEVLWPGRHSSIQSACVAADRAMIVRAFGVGGKTERDAEWTTIVNWFLTCYVEIKNDECAWPHAIKWTRPHICRPHRIHLTHRIYHTLISSNSFSFALFFFSSLWCLYLSIALPLSCSVLLSVRRHYVINMYIKCNDSLVTYSICYFRFRKELSENDTNTNTHTDNNKK